MWLSFLWRSDIEDVRRLYRQEYAARRKLEREMNRLFGNDHCFEAPNISGLEAGLLRRIHELDERLKKLEGE